MRASLWDLKRVAVEQCALEVAKKLWHIALSV
jgi:hypothetical protein